MARQSFTFENKSYVIIGETPDHKAIAASPVEGNRGVTLGYFTIDAQGAHPVPNASSLNVADTTFFDDKGTFKATDAEISTVLNKHAPGATLVPTAPAGGTPAPTGATPSPTQPGPEQENPISKFFGQATQQSTNPMTWVLGLIAAVIGFLVGGPIGAIIGGLLGFGGANLAMGKPEGNDTGTTDPTTTVSTPAPTTMREPTAPVVVKEHGVSTGGITTLAADTILTDKEGKPHPARVIGMQETVGGNKSFAWQRVVFANSEGKFDHNDPSLIVDAKELSQVGSLPAAQSPLFNSPRSLVINADNQVDGDGLQAIVTNTALVRSIRNHGEALPEILQPIQTNGITLLGGVSKPDAPLGNGVHIIHEASPTKDAQGKFSSELIAVAVTDPASGKKYAGYVALKGNSQEADKEHWELLPKELTFYDGNKNEVFTHPIVEGAAGSYLDKNHLITRIDSSSVVLNHGNNPHSLNTLITGAIKQHRAEMERAWTVDATAELKPLDAPISAVTIDQTAKNPNAVVFVPRKDKDTNNTEWLSTQPVELTLTREGASPEKVKAVLHATAVAEKDQPHPQAQIDGYWLVSEDGKKYGSFVFLNAPLPVGSLETEQKSVVKHHVGPMGIDVQTAETVARIKDGQEITLANNQRALLADKIKDTLTAQPAGLQLGISPEQLGLELGHTQASPLYNPVYTAVTAAQYAKLSVGLAGVVNTLKNKFKATDTNDATLETTSADPSTTQRVFVGHGTGAIAELIPPPPVTPPVPRGAEERSPAP